MGAKPVLHRIKFASVNGVLVPTQEDKLVNRQPVIRWPPRVSGEVTGNNCIRNRPWCVAWTKHY